MSTSIPNWIRLWMAQLSGFLSKQHNAPEAPSPSSKEFKDKPFDPLAFCDYVHDYGQAYRYRSKVLISLCQAFAVTSEQSFRHYDERLSRMLEACDKAMKRAANLKKKEMHQESEQAFRMAIRELKDYAKMFHFRKEKDVQDKIKAAMDDDENNKYKRWDHSKDETMIEVEFHICSTLPCHEPIKVRQMLSSTSVSEVLPEILWNFSHYEVEYASLAQNPHLYTELPPSLNAYQSTFNHMPAQTLPKANRYHCSGGENRDSGDNAVDNTEHRDPLTVHLLTNNSRRVFFGPELGKKEKPQVFDKVWVEDTLIFKGVHGELMGENSESFERSISKNGTTLWYKVQPPKGQTGSAGQATSWTELIDKLREHRDADIVISTTEPEMPTLA